MCVCPHNVHVNAYPAVLAIALKCACNYEDGNMPSSSASRCNSSNLCEADEGCYVKRHEDNSLSRGCADAKEFGTLERFVPIHMLLNCKLHEPTGDVYFRCCYTELCNKDLETDLYPTTPPPENATSPVLVITPAGKNSLSVCHADQSTLLVLRTYTHTHACTHARTHIPVLSCPVLVSHCHEGHVVPK